LTKRAGMLSFTRHELALIAITLVWGGTFLVVQKAMTVSGPAFFVGIRFLAAGIITAVLFHKAMRGFTRTELVGGSAIGFTLAIGYGLQTYGLQTITSSQSAFLTALYVPIVPLLQWVVLRRPPRLMSWIGVAFAFAGLILLAGPDAGTISLSAGEIATILCAIAVAAEIILIGRLANDVDSRRITAVQLLTGGLFSLMAMPLTGESVPEFSWIWALAAIGMGFASCIIQLTMNWAQKEVSPTRATVIYAGEPVWAGIFGRIAGERLPALALLGAALIVIGVIVSELQPKKSMKDEPEK
jgi:drug/metabolite transporter (DMT)-like permease